MLGLDLFSGIGGLTLAMEGIARPVAYCERDRHAQAVLLSRQRDGGLPVAPIWDDVQSLTSYVLACPIDIIWGGFPCQDISCAGNGAGLGGSRSGLFFEIIRLTRELRPRFVFLENVPAITVRGLDRVLLEFTSLGYDCRWTIVSAAEMGALHLRERWFLLAHSNGERGGIESNRLSRRSLPSESWVDGEKESMANTDSEPSEPRGLQIRENTQDPMFRIGNKYRSGDNQWTAEPDVGRVAHGVPLRVDRLRGLGNAVVPAQAREAFLRLSGIK